MKKIVLIIMLMAHSAYSYVPSVWEKQVVAACLILEASNQGDEGMWAVANVIDNRAKQDPSQIYGVIKKPKAFSAFNNRSNGFASHVRKASRDENWRRALLMVDWLYKGQLRDTTSGATHYTRVEEKKSWMQNMKVTRVIRDHKFLKEL